MSVLSNIKYRLRLAERQDPSTVIHNITYFSGTDIHKNHKLDIYLPSLSSSSSLLSATSTNEVECQPKIPIVLHVHGGGWVRGSRKNNWRGGPAVGRACANEGFVGVVVSYRLARISLPSFIAWSLIFGLILFIVSIVLFSWQLITGYFLFMISVYIYHTCVVVPKTVNLEHMIDDLCYALIYIRDHIHEHYSQADPNKIFISGHSAGAHLISLLILDRSHFQRHNLLLTSIRGVITMSGIYSLENPTHDSYHHIRNWIFRILYLSNLIYPEGKTKFEYSPIEYVKENEQVPPFLVMSARFDMGLEIDAKRFVEKLGKCNYNVEYHTIGGMTTHGTLASKFSKNEARQHFFSFIRQHIKNN